MKLKLVIWFISVCIYACYEMKCPETTQRFTRARALCMNPSKYSCIEDLRNNRYRENCTFVDFEQPGKRIVFSGDIDARWCPKHQYHPRFIPYWTNTSTDCIYERSRCSELGQVKVYDIDVNKDTTCRCDYTKGYDYVNRPQNVCSCIPSQEDCSCYRRHCPFSKDLLSPDYRCVSVVFVGTYNCPAILTVGEDETTSTDIPFTKPTRLGILTLSNDHRIFRAIAVSVIIILLGIVEGISVFILHNLNQRKRNRERRKIEEEKFNDTTDELQSVSKELSNVKGQQEVLEKRFIDVIPPAQEDRVKEELESWSETDQDFVTTAAAEKILSCIKTYNFVIVTGNAGIGKTSAVRHAALQLQQDGYIIVPTSKPEDIVYVYNKKPKVIFIIDDLCGKYTLNQHFLDNVKPILDDLKIVLKTCQIIATCRLQVFKDERFKNLSKLQYAECNMNSEDLCLTEMEKTNMANAYFGENKAKFVELYKNYDCFPFLCKHLCKMTVESFPSNPFDCFKNEFEYYLNGGEETGKYKFYALCLIAISNNNLDEDLFLNVTTEKQNLIEDVLFECKLNKGTSLKNIVDALQNLQGSLVVKSKNEYSIIHDKLFDYIAYYFGTNMINLFVKYGTSELISERFIWKGVKKDIEFSIMLPENMLDSYITRIINDWTLGRVVDVIGNRNMENKDFVERFLNQVQQLDEQKRFSLANIVDNNKSTSFSQGNFGGRTSVYAACQYGHLEILNKLIDYNADIHKCDERGITPVNIACYYGRFNILNRLLECKADVDNCSLNGASPVYAACSNGHLDTLDILIKNEADINKYRNDGASSVYVACKKGHLDILNRLIESKANTNKCCDDGRSPVYAACQNGHLEILNRLIECKADINKCCNDGTSPVYAACQNGHLKILNRLIECNADVNKCCNDGTSPVYAACQNGHLKLLNRLIECNADINQCYKNGVSLVYIACENGHLDILNRLIECGANINKCCDDGESPVYAACQNDHLDILNRLIECKADIDKCCDDDTSPVFIACQNGHLMILNRLIECKADINKCCDDGFSPVLVACLNGHLDILNRLIECKADINNCCDDGTSPVYAACYQGHLDILKRLIECNANINTGWNNGTSPVYAACQNGHLGIFNTLLEYYKDINKCPDDCESLVFATCFNGHLDILNRLIECNADINNCCDDDDDCISPVYIACQNGHLQILNRLIECKADINKCCDRDDTTPVYAACQNGHLKLLNRLIECKADINNCYKNGVSLVYIACENGHLDILNRLIECGADINKCCDDGASPVCIACANGHLEILNRLIECKADINKCCNDGASPVYIACENGHLEILNRLIECKADINKCRDNGASPVYIACYNGHLKILNRLMECKADINKCCNNGTSPVSAACYKGHLDILNRLVECGADINIGLSPLDAARSVNNSRIVKRLLELQ